MPARLRLLFAAALALGAAVAVWPALAAGSAAATFAPVTLFAVHGRVDGLAADGPRVALVRRAPGRVVVELRTLRGRLLAATGLPARHGGYGLLAFGGTALVLNRFAYVGNTELAGSWLLLRPGVGVGVLRRYASRHEGAGTTCCPVVSGQGVAAQGTVVAYGLAGTARRVVGLRSRLLATRIRHVWAVNARRVLVQRPSGSLVLLSAAGAPLARLAPSAAGAVRAAALQGKRVVVVRGTAGGGSALRLDVYDAGSGAAVASWPIGDLADPSQLTLSAGLAVYGQVGRHPAQLLRLVDGRQASLPVAAPVGALHLTRSGLVYGRGDGHGGVLVTLLPTAQLTAALS